MYSLLLIEKILETRSCPEFEYVSFRFEISVRTNIFYLDLSSFEN